MVISHGLPRKTLIIDLMLLWGHLGYVSSYKKMEYYFSVAHDRFCFWLCNIDEWNWTGEWVNSLTSSSSLLLLLRNITGHGEMSNSFRSLWSRVLSGSYLVHLSLFYNWQHVHTLRQHGSHCLSLVGASVAIPSFPNPSLQILSACMQASARKTSPPVPSQHRPRENRGAKI